MSEPFHTAFTAALDGRDATLRPWLAEAGAGPLAVYRNTVAKGRIDALAALFPTVERLVGQDWFRDAALIFTRAHPPTGPVLDEYGGDFPGWLATFEPARELPYLAPAARLDLAWGEAHRAADAPVLEARSFAGVPSDRMFAAHAVLHPSVRLFDFDWTAPSIWLANRPELQTDAEPVWDRQPEALAIYRPLWTVEARRLSPAEWRLLDGSRRGSTLGEAALLAIGREPGLDLARLFSGLVQAGLFTRVELDAR